jgi:5-formyltetrahydrofolate cyclo-ligase
MQFSKQALRSLYLNKRKALADGPHAEGSLAMAQQCLLLPLWDKSIFHLFMPITRQKEVDTHPLLTLLQGKDKQVVLPKVEGKRLSHFLLTDDTLLKENAWGIAEPLQGIPIAPAQVDVVFVPLLAFDEQGHRVGYGQGFYDAFLAQCAPTTLKIGLSFFSPVPKIEAIEKTDIALNYVITPTKIFTF